MRVLGLLSGAVLVTALALAAPSGCYRPEPADGGFRCSPDLGGLCPNGLTCSPQGLCVQTISKDGGVALDLSGDLAFAQLPRTCDERIAQGAFANLTALTALNTAADEEHLALDPTGTAPRLVFQRGNQLFTAAISTTDAKVVSAPQAVTLTGAPGGLVVSGSTFTKDGKLWVAGTAAGSTGLYPGTPAGVTDFTLGPARAPAGGACAFSDPTFMQNDSTFQLYLAYELGGCGQGSYVVRSALDRNLAASYSALPDHGWGAPSMTPSGLMLLVSSTTGGRHLHEAMRSDLQYQFSSAGRISMAAIGEAMEDRQAIVSSDCRVIYFSSVRTGGVGGADLYAADILAD